MSLHARFFASAMQLVGPSSPTDTEPKWNMLYPRGEWYRDDYPDGKANFDDSFFRPMVANWERIGKPGLQINLHHRGDSFPDGVRNEDKEAVGFIEALDIRGDGLWGLIRWNEKGRELILSDKYRCLSPEWSFNARNKRTGQPQGPTLYGAGLLNDPYFDEMPRVAASAAPQAGTPAATGGNRMDPIRLMLGLPATATDAEVQAAVAALQSERKVTLAAATEKLEKLTAAHGETTKALTAAQELVKAKAEEVTKLSARVTELEGEKQETALKSLCEELVTDRRIRAAQHEQVRTMAKAIGFEAAAKFFRELPKGTVQAGGEVGIAGPSNGGVSTDDASKRFFARIEELQKEKKGLTFPEARRLATRENPELARAVFGGAGSAA